MVFAKRNVKEITRDILTLIFGAIFPLVLLILFSIINSSIPQEAHMTLYEPENIAPGIAMFGLSFLALFVGMLISKDRCSSFILRLFTSPLKTSDYILGYTLPILPMAILQSAMCYVVALIMGLEFSPKILLAIVVNIPAMVFFIGIGLLCGTLFNEKMVSTLCGAILANISGWISDIWFDISLIGGAFEKITNLLPFVHAVKASRMALSGDYSNILPELCWVIGYTVVIVVVAVIAFNHKMKNDK